MARPTKLNDEIQETIVTNLASCAHRAVAAACAGIGKRTFVEWMRKGKEKPASRHGRFRRAILEAEKRAEMRLATLIASAAGDDPNHAKWMLTHRFPRRWAERTKTEITGANGRPLEMTVDVRAELLDRINRIAEQRGAGKADSEPEPGEGSAA